MPHKACDDMLILQGAFERVAQLFAIETEKLTKFYGKTKGISGVDLAVLEGQIFGFIGPNGAGKTTTIRILLNMIFPTGGKARIFGLDCVQDSLEIRRIVGYLPSEMGLYGSMKVKDMLDYSKGFYEKDCSEKAAELARFMELELEQRIDNLSLGNKKKLGIVLSLMHEPRLVILDEPTSGLDPLMQKRINDLMREENKKGVTIFLSSHVLMEVQRLCHEVAIIRDGSIIQVEDIESLRKRRLKRVKISLKDTADFIPTSMPGIFDVEKENGTFRFMFEGNLPSLLVFLSKYPLEDLIVEEPTLEEIFMHYYEEGESRHF